MASEAALIRLLSDLAKSRLGRELDHPAREDLVQQAVTDVLARFPELPDDEFARLAFVRMRHRLLEARRNEGNRARLLRERSQDIAPAGSSAPDPSELAADAESRAELRRAIVDALTPEQRTILLRHFQGREPLEELAASLGISRATAARRIAEAIALLGKAIRLSSGA